jgi:hypothetical protein
MREPKKHPSDLAERFQLRLPDGLRDRIAAAAKAEGRSMNAEIVKTLEAYYPPQPTVDQLLESLDMFARDVLRDGPRGRSNLLATLQEVADHLRAEKKPTQPGWSVHFSKFEEYLGNLGFAFVRATKYHRTYSRGEVSLTVSALDPLPEEEMNRACEVAGIDPPRIHSFTTVPKMTVHEHDG